MNGSCLQVVEHRITSIFKPIVSASKSQKPEQIEDLTPLDEAPLIVGSVIEEAPLPGQPSAFATKRLQGGLQTAAQLREENKRRKAAVEAEKSASRATAAAQKSASGNDGQEDTVYRDKSGRRIDTKAEKAELARQKREELQKEMQKMEWGKGLIQREEREQRQRDIDNMANKPMARYADDEEMNAEMKDRGRWNDPAANFLESTSGSNKQKKKAPQKPKYAGPMPPPNRFGIPPGYR